MKDKSIYELYLNGATVSDGVDKIYLCENGDACTVEGEQYVTDREDINKRFEVCSDECL